MKKRIGVASAVVAAAAAVTSALLARRARFFAHQAPQRNETFTTTSTSAGPVATKDIPPPPRGDFSAPTPPVEETPRASYELDPALIQLVGVLCLIGGCLGLVVYAILSIDE